MILIPTSSIVSRGIRHESISDFLEAMSEWFERVSSEVLKVETLQTYEEKGNPSWRAFLQDDVEEAIRLLPPTKVGDESLYKDLRNREVEFIRCRPVQFPLSKYLRWEMENYKMNRAMGENIYLCNIEDVQKILDEHIQKDFIVFDTQAAFVHNYDDTGNLVGGWSISLPSDINALRDQFMALKSAAIEFPDFVSQNWGRR